MEIPILPPSEKRVGESIPCAYDWASRLALAGDTSAISQSTWKVDVGTATFGASGRVSTIAGTVTTGYLSGGNPGEKCVINNSITTAAGNKFVQLFDVKIKDGAYAT